MATGQFFGTTDGFYRGDITVVSETSHAANTATPLHAHAEGYVCVVLAGAFTEVSDGRSEYCDRGTVVVHPAGETHRDAFHDRGTCLNVATLPEWRAHDRVLENTFASRRVLAAPQAIRLAREIRRELRTATVARALAIDGLTLQLLAMLARDTRRSDGSRRPAWISQSLDVMQDSVEAPSIAELAALAHVHPSHFARVFRHHVGCAPSEWLRRARIERAAELLATTRRPLVVIAEACGFCDQAHFARMFRRVVGLTPGEYRRAHRA